MKDASDNIRDWVYSTLSSNVSYGTTAINLETNNTTWSGITSGARCYYENNIDNNVYGALYNIYAITDSRNIANTGWHVPTLTELQTLADYLGAESNYLVNDAGGKLKVTGTTYWDAPNTGATNEKSFNGRGAGIRGASGVFYYNKVNCYIASSTEHPSLPGSHYSALLLNNNASLYISLTGATGPKVGRSVRLIKDSTSLTDGQTSTYTGNDGRVYDTICIGTQEWLAENLLETSYRSGGSVVPVYSFPPKDSDMPFILIAEQSMEKEDGTKESWMTRHTVTIEIYTSFTGNDASYVPANTIGDSVVQLLRTRTQPTISGFTCVVHTINGGMTDRILLEDKIIIVKTYNLTLTIEE